MRYLYNSIIQTLRKEKKTFLKNNIININKDYLLFDNYEKLDELL